MQLTNHEQKIKNYILWPFIAIVSTAAIYLVLVYYVYKGLLFFQFTENFIWNNFTKNDLVIINDPRNRKIQNIINRLPDSLLPKNYKKIQLITINSEEINAFAAPGGRIIITKGLLDNISNDPALLFVIGHEIGHLFKQDHLKELAKAIVAKLYNIITFSDLFTDLLSLIHNYENQRYEFFADRKAVEIVSFLYKNPKGIEELFDKLANNSQNQLSLPYFLTHPNINERKEKILSMMKDKTKKS